MFSRYLTFTDLKNFGRDDVGPDVMAALVVTFMSVPQGIAYAMIAGLPPAVGLYAAAVPVIIGSMLRSSRHVVTGPTNALSLLVGSAVAAGIGGDDPVQVGLTLAFMVGLFQFVAGALRLGAIIDYISGPVVLGYMTGAGVLIGVGQLRHITQTGMERGHLVHRLASWIGGISGAAMLPVAMAAGTAVLILILRKIDRRLPGAMISMVLATALSWGFSLSDMGMRVVKDISPVPAGFPPFTVPTFSTFGELLPIAVACTVLSLVEATAVARTICIKTGQRLDTSAEFVGQGLANIAAGFFGAYPTSGSLSRSTLNFRAGARTRFSGTLGGFMMIAVLLALGPLVNLTPISSLAGLLVVVAIDLIDIPRIRTTLKSTAGDWISFLATVIGTWAMPLDKAIYLGIGISVVAFLRQVRLLTFNEIMFSPGEGLREVNLDAQSESLRRCSAIRVLHVGGSLFFGAAAELQSGLDEVIRDTKVKVIVLRLKRAHDLDMSVAGVLKDSADLLTAAGRHLVITGLSEGQMSVLERTGIAQSIGTDNLFPVRGGWFVSLKQGIARALELTGTDHGCGSTCPVKEYLSENPVAKCAESGTPPTAGSTGQSPEESSSAAGTRGDAAAPSSAAASMSRALPASSQ